MSDVSLPLGAIRVQDRLLLPEYHVCMYELMAEKGVPIYLVLKLVRLKNCQVLRVLQVAIEIVSPDFDREPEIGGPAF